MGYFVIVGLLAIASLLGLFVLAAMHVEKDPDNPRKASFDSKPYAVATVIGAVIVFVLVTAFASTDTVANGHIGIKKQFGALVGTTGTGLVTHAPWQSVAEVSVQNELKTYDMTTKDTSAVSSDSQPVFLTVQVNYSLDPLKAVDTYKETGSNFVEKILDPAVFQNVKEVTARYKAIEFAKNREAIRTEAEKKLTAEVAKHGIIIQNVSLKNVSFTDDLSKAIEATVEAEQNAKAADQTVKIKKAEANQKIAEAKGIATATLVQARADAQSQKLKQRTLTPLLVQMAAIDKLNPNVQVIVCTQGQNCVPQAFVQANPVGSTSTNSPTATVTKP